MSYCWRFIVSKNRLQCNSTKIPHGYWRQANLFVSITIRTDLPSILLPMRLRNDLSFSKIAIFHFVKKNGKISAQPYPTKCIQFLDRENNEKKQYVAIGKTDLFFNSMGLCGNFTINQGARWYQLSRSECKPTPECLYHSFSRWTCCSQNWFIHLAIYTKTSKFYSLIWMVLCFSMLPVGTTSCSDAYGKFLWETGFAYCFYICQIIDQCSSNCPSFALD